MFGIADEFVKVRPEISVFGSHMRLEAKRA